MGGDLQPWPVEISVICELPTGIGDLLEKEARGGLELALNANERRTRRAERVGGCDNHGRIFTNENHLALALLELRRGAQKLPHGEVGRLAGLGEQTELTTCGVGWERGKIQRENWCAELIRDHADRGPNVATALGVVPSIEACPPCERSQHQARYGAISIKGMAVASERLRCKPWERDVVHGQPRKDGDGGTEQALGGIGAVTGEAPQDAPTPQLVEPTQQIRLRCDGNASRCKNEHPAFFSCVAIRTPILHGAAQSFNGLGQRIRKLRMTKTFIELSQVHSQIDAPRRCCAK